jgi:hypothetical protein
MNWIDEWGRRGATGRLPTWRDAASLGISLYRLMCLCYPGERVCGSDGWVEASLGCYSGEVSGSLLFSLSGGVVL